MKNSIARVLTLLSLVVLSLAGVAAAQYTQRIVRANVPFDFTAGHKSFPSGDYLIVQVTPDRLEVRDARGNVLASLIAHSARLLSPSASTRLEFSTVDGRHALLRVWIAGEVTGSELPAPKNGIVLAQRDGGKSLKSSGGGNK
jgi:hypothetical protein